MSFCESEIATERLLYYFQFTVKHVNDSPAADFNLFLECYIVGCCVYFVFGSCVHLRVAMCYNSRNRYNVSAHLYRRLRREETILSYCTTFLAFFFFSWTFSECLKGFPVEGECWVISFQLIDPSVLRVITVVQPSGKKKKVKCLESFQIIQISRIYYFDGLRNLYIYIVFVFFFSLFLILKIREILTF